MQSRLFAYQVILLTNEFSIYALLLLQSIEQLAKENIQRIIENYEIFISSLILRLKQLPLQGYHLWHRGV